MCWLPALMLAVVPSHVSVSMHDTIARFVVRTEVQVEAGPSGGPELLLELPEHAMIFAGSVRVGGYTEPLKLTRTSTVDAKFAELFTAPETGSRPWALRIDRDGDAATFEIDAPRAATLELQLTMDAPTCFLGDRRYVHVADGWSDRLPSLRPTVARDDIETLCGAVEGGSWIALGTREVSAQPGGERRVGVVSSQLPLASRRIARVEIALASELMPIPEDLHTAILVDRSRSVTAEELDNEEAIISGYLAAAPRTRVQVIAFSRTTQPLLAGWMIAGQARDQIGRALRSLPPRNGSDVDAALSAASAWLQHANGTRRVLLLTDERLALRLSDHVDTLAKLLPAHTLAHVVIVDGTSGTVDRDDLAVLEPLAKQTGGIAADVGLGDNGTVDVRALVQPLTVDHVKLEGPGWSESISDTNACFTTPGDTLAAGRSCIWWGDGLAGAGPLTLTGEMWGHTIKRTFVPDPGQALAVARILSALGSFAGDVQQEIDLAAHAVNGVWSLFALWGGSGGYGQPGPGDEVTSGISIGRIGTGSSDSIIDTIGLVTSADELTRQLRAAVASCKPEEIIVARVETTFDEIVDVEIITPDLEAPVETCIREAIWDTSLALPDPLAHANPTLLFQRS